ncbi:MAG TPA: two-component system response regulator [candidate division Zixibacteria bacterium]|jgi:twitching motility two-component system response regulator PilG|nr:two-component system response regulator [candidate division Zixibacteria bacterium]
MKRILVVDDDPNMLLLISDLLTRGHYLVSQATSGASALQQARSVVPDLMVLDVMMPGLDGFEICRLIKADPGLQTIKVIMVTAKTQDKDIETGLSAGADYYVTKPFRIAELSAKIRDLIG